MNTRDNIVILCKLSTYSWMLLWTQTIGIPMNTTVSTHFDIPLQIRITPLLKLKPVDHVWLSFYHVSSLYVDFTLTSRIRASIHSKKCNFIIEDQLFANKPLFSYHLVRFSVLVGLCFRPFIPITSISNNVQCVFDFIKFACAVMVLWLLLSTSTFKF